MNRGKWGSVIRFALVAFAPLAVAAVGPAEAQQTAPAGRQPMFRYERSVQPAGPGANRLLLDADVVGAGQPFRVVPVAGAVPDSNGRMPVVAEGGLGDLRLFDRAGHEVPYLLLPPERPVANWESGAIQPLPPTKTTSGFELTLAAPKLVDRLRVEGLPQRFLKRAALSGSGDREHWTLLNDQVTLFDLPDQRLKQLDVAFQPGEYRYLRLTWDDRNSGKVPLPTTVSVREATKIPEPEPVKVSLRIERRSSEPGRSHYRIVFPSLGLPVTDIEIAAYEPNILRVARITEPQLSGDRLLPRELGSGTLRRATRDGVSVGDLRVPIQVPASRQVELTIEDGSNPPLPSTEAFAVLAPLPWIYFESADGAPLVARLGDPKLPAPSYDLEAIRPNLSKIATTSATWAPAASMSSTPVEETDVLPAAAVAAGATLDISNFRYSRPVPGSVGLTALALDPPALAHSRLSDLRLVDRDGHQRAYILESREEPQTIMLPPLKPAAARDLPSWMPPMDSQPQGRGHENRTTYVIRLPDEGLPASRLVLTTPARVFTRAINAFIEEPATTRDRASANRIASATWGHADPGDAAPRLTLDLPALQTADLVLQVDEGDNAPLPIDSAALLLPGYQLRFVRTVTDSSPLTLYYGGDDTIGSPRYDLALLKPYLLGAPAAEITPGPEQERAPAAMAVHLPTWAFWSVLVVAVLILLALIVRLLRAEQETTTA